MAITLQDTARNAAANGIVDLIDVGGAGTINIKSAASIVIATNEVATLTFPATAFGAAAAGVATAGTIVSDTSATGGTAGFYTIFSGGGTALWQGLVATSASDLNLSSVSIGVGDTVSISAFTLTVPAS
jgi:hypothetical protein